VPSGKRLDVHIPKYRAGLILCFRNIERAMKKTNIILSIIAILSLILCSGCSRTEDFPFKVGDEVRVVLLGGNEVGFKVTNIKGKWIEGGAAYGVRNPIGVNILHWFNSDNFTSLVKIPPE